MTRAHHLRLAVLTLLAVTHLWLPPFTFANPPELPWLAGVFDAADADDVGLIEMAMTAVVEARPANARRPELAPPLPVPIEPALPPILSPRALSIRAPPAA